MKTLVRETHILDQQLALSAYLEALLDEAPAEAVVAAHIDTTPAAVSAQTPPAAAPETARPSAEAGVPEWAATRFQALLFEVAGLTLAVPLVKLKGVVTGTDGLTPMPGQSPLFAGLVNYHATQSRVVDTARLVLPPARLQQLDADVVTRCTNLVMIDEGRLALACSRIGDVIELDSDEVRWRGAAGKRLWLAGTLIERMCALLDVDALVRELEAAAA